MPAPAHCPECSQPLPGDDGWPAWCEHCDWGVDRHPPEQPRSRVLRWWPRLVDTALRAEHARLLADPASITRRPRLQIVVVATAIALHAVTAALVAATVLVAMTGAALVFKIGIGVVCLGIAVVVAPRPVRRSADVWRRDDAPALFALLDAIAAAVGTITPRGLRVTSEPGITSESGTGSTGRRRHRTLSIGLPLWHVLQPGQRVALLASELARGVNADVRDDLVVRTALTSLTEWLDLLRPTETELRIEERRKQRHRRLPSTTRLSEIVLPIALSPFYVVVLCIGSVLTLTALRCGQRAEHRADVIAARVAGVEAMRGCLDAEIVSEATSIEMAVALRRSRDADLLETARLHVAGLPPREKNRLRRLALVRPQNGTTARLPAALRDEFVSMLDPAPPTLVVPPELMARAADEMGRAADVVRRELRERLTADPA